MSSDRQQVQLDAPSEYLRRSLLARYLLMVSDGQVIGERSFRSHAEGLEAAGLEK